MTETEKLLDAAQDLARRIFEEPSEGAVMDIFQRLCDEADATRCNQEIADHGQTIH